MGYSEAGSFARVAFTWGRLRDSRLNVDAQNMDMDDILVVCEEITDNWNHSIDIQGFEEEGYIQPYAERVLLEKYGL